MKKTYLTIDLDFWVHSQVDMPFVEEAINAVEWGKVAAAVHHDSILAHTDRFESACTHLINLDHHSDVGGDLVYIRDDSQERVRRLSLHSGSWVDYTDFRVSQRYLWLYPNRRCLDECRCDHFTFDVKFSQIGKEYGIAWRQLSHRLAKPPDYGINLADVQALSIVLSPDWCGPDAFDSFIDLVRKYNLELIDWLPENLNITALRGEKERSDRKRGELDSLEPNSSFSHEEEQEYSRLLQIWMSEAGRGGESLSEEEVSRLAELAQRRTCLTDK